MINHKLLFAYLLITDVIRNCMLFVFQQVQFGWLYCKQKNTAYLNQILSTMLVC